jgi:hypothetical protein
VQDRQRRQQQRHARPDNPTNDDEEPQVGLRRPYSSYRRSSRCVCRTCRSHGAKRAHFGSTSSPQEPVLDSYAAHEPSDSPQLDGIGGDISEGSWSGHTNGDVYGVSDGEQEARRPAISQQDDQDEAEIAQLATRLGGQSLEPSGRRSRSPIPEREPPEVELGESSTATRLLKQLYSFQGCTNKAHQAHDDEHAQFQFHPREEPCHSFADLLQLQELKPSGPMPDVLSSPTLMGKSLERPKFDPA